MAFKLISIKNVCSLNALNSIQVCLHDKSLSKNENHRKINTNKHKSFIFEMFTNLYKKSNHHKKVAYRSKIKKKKNWIQCYGWKLIQSTIVRGIENCSDFQRDKRKKKIERYEKRGESIGFSALRGVKNYNTRGIMSRRTSCCDAI